MTGWATRFRWWLWAALTVLATAAMVVLRGLFVRPPGAGSRVVLPDVPPPVKKRAEAAQEAALVVKAQAAAKSEAQQQQLAEIAKIPDGHARRQRLANFVRGL